MTNNKAPRYSDKYLLFLQENICCVYSLEVPHLGSSGEECNICLQISVESLQKSTHNIYVFDEKKKKKKKKKNLSRAYYHAKITEIQ